MKNLFICFLLTTFSLNSWAAEIDKSAQAEELMAVMSIDSMMDAMYSQIGTMMQGMRSQLSIKPSEQVIFDKYNTKIIELMKHEMSWEKIKQPMIQIYVDNYTKKELEDLLVFYKSDTGQSTLKKMPVIMMDSIRLTQSLLQDFLPKIQVLSRELENEIRLERLTH